MQDLPFYPIKIVSRSVTRKRTRRALWMGMGTAFVLGCVCAFSPATMPFPWETQGIAQVASLQEPEDILDNLSPSAPAIPAPAASFTPQPAVQHSPKPRQTAAAAYPLSLEMNIENGDTLISLLTDAGVPSDDAHNAAESIRRVYDTKKLTIGHNIGVVLDKNPHAANQDGAPRPMLASLTLPISSMAQLQLTRQKDGDDFSIKKINVPIETRLVRTGGHIDSSLYETGQAAGLPPALINEIINAYSYDVDFQHDMRDGASIDVLYERLQTREGAPAGHGNVIYAELELGDRAMKIYRYVDKDGNADYYNAHGESVRKALLRTPVNGAHITSTYGMRLHPLLGYSRMHRGIDFGAPIGTPIYAAGDGVIEFMGRKGGYGNYLRIRHNTRYSSAYGHISRFASHLAPGSHVKQGQIVAYVGMTGLATGPHLHYEILVNNEQVNPANVKFRGGNVLEGRELLAFRKTIERIDTRLASMPPKSDIAMASLSKQSINND